MLDEAEINESTYAINVTGKAKNEMDFKI